MTCPFEKIHVALDRFQEAHFYLHQMENSYHFADHFRWSLNSYIRALKEVPQLISMGLQNEKGFPDWFREERETLNSDSLIYFLNERRDFIVHRGMFLPGSSGSIGIAEGRGMKLGLSIPIDSLSNSDDCMYAFAYHCLVKGEDFFDLFKDDEDSLPCIERKWILEQFPNHDVIDLCAKAWLTVGETVRNVLVWLGGTPPELSLGCRHSAQHIRFRLYDRNKIRKEVEGMQKLSELGNASNNQAF